MTAPDTVAEARADSARHLKVARDAVHTAPEVALVHALLAIEARLRLIEVSLDDIAAS
jgi:hypothetical protein